MRTQTMQQQYIATQISTADRLQLVVMLYEGAIAFLNQAKEKMAQKDASGKGLFISKALDIIAELNASLNFQEGRELAANLFHLYNFMTAHLTRANLNWDLKAVEEVQGMLMQLRDSWQEVCQKAKRGEIGEEVEITNLPPRNIIGSVVV